MASRKQKLFVIIDLPELERLILGAYACNGIESGKSKVELISIMII